MFQKLRVFCVECGLVEDAPYSCDGRLSPPEIFSSIGWMLSLIEKHPAPVLAFLCPKCQKEHLEPPLLKAATEALSAKPPTH